MLSSPRYRSYDRTGKGKITSGEIQKMFDVSRDTANRYLKKLSKLKLIERHGEGRSTYYVLS